MHQLRYYQTDAISAIKAALNMGENPICKLPTGAGKSIIIALIAEWVARNKPDYRILICAHRAELLVQNAGKIQGDVGIYSAGLQSREASNQIVVGGIQSIYNQDLGKFNLLLLDECQFLSPDPESMYYQLIIKLQNDNPNIRIVGLSATPYRMDGKIPFLDDICYEISTKQLIDDGYLSPLISKVSSLKPILDSVPIIMGEYAARKLEEIMIDQHTMLDFIESMIKYGKERKSWIVFCSGVEHTKLTAKLLNENGITTEYITGDTKREDRDNIYDLFKHGEVQAICNCDVLTTGFDAPNIDFLVMGRPTESRILYEQMVGRGLRLSPETGKENCLILDFAGNINRHGTITNLMPLEVKLKRHESTEGYTHKTCPVCETVAPIRDRECIECHYEFAQPREVKHDGTPADIDILGDGCVWRSVDMVAYNRHEKKKDNGLSVTLRVTYICGTEEYSEWICVEHEGWAGKKAKAWVDARCNTNQYTVSHLLTLPFKEPSRIRTVRDGKYTRILAYDFTKVERHALDEARKVNLLENLI